MSGTGVLALSYPPVVGATVPAPEGETAVVNWYCVLKFAVYVTLLWAGAVTVCDIAPPSDQLAHAYCVPEVPACGLVVARVCWAPWAQVVLVALVVLLPPSTE